MKYTCVLTLLLWSVLIQNGDLNAQHRTIICGEILPKDTVEEVVLFRKWSTPVFDPKIDIFTTVTENGHFRFEIDLTTIAVFTFSVDDQSFIGNYAGESSIYLEPGDSLFLRIDPASERMSDIGFSGRGVEKQYLKRKIGEVYRTYNDGRRHSFDFEIKSAISCKNAVLETISQYKEKLTNEAYNSILSESLASLLSSFAHTLLDNPFDATQAELEMAYQITRHNFSSDELLAVNSGRTNYLAVYQDYALLEFLSRNDLPISRAYSKNKMAFFYALKVALNGSSLKEALLANYLVHSAKVWGWDDRCELIFAELQKEFGRSSRFYMEAARVRDSFKQIGSSTKGSLNFVLYDTLNQEVSLNRYLGSVVLIDFMFTGCGGCVSMAPALAQVEKTFGHDEVAFLSISIDPSLSKFRSGVGKFSSPGSVPLYTGGSGNSHEIIDYFNIIAYPTLVLINRQGQVVEGRASDPRTLEGRERLNEAIRQLLIK